MKREALKWGALFWASYMFVEPWLVYLELNSADLRIEVKQIQRFLNFWDFGLEYRFSQTQLAMDFGQFLYDHVIENVVWVTYLLKVLFLCSIGGLIYFAVGAAVGCAVHRRRAKTEAG